MRFVRRRPELPAEVAGAVDRGERVLASAQGAEGTWVLATRAALVLVPASAESVRLPWESVHRADWDSETATLTVEPVQDYGRPVARTSVELVRPGPLLDVVRERVTASVVLQRRVEPARGRGFVVIARRPPSGAGQVRWAVEYDPGVAPDDPAVSAVVEDALREAQESLGHP